MRVLVAIWILLISSDAVAQSDLIIKNWDSERLGFGCSFSGQMTRPVLNITRFLTETRYNEMKKFLYSEVPAYQFLATFVLEELRDKSEMSVSNEELERIDEIKRSDLKVPVCSGCTHWTEVSLRSLFDTEKKDIIYISAEYWFEQYYTMQSQKKGR